MTDICLPIDASAGVPSFPAAQHRAALAALMIGRTDRPLGALSGVRPGSEPTITATSTTWTVTPFAAVVDPETALTVGPYLVAFTANKTGGVTAADATNPRIDRLDLQVPDDPSGGTTTPVIVYTAGVAAASPAAPAAPARSTPLAQISVPKAGGGAPSVSLTFRRLAAGIVVARDSSEYPAHPYTGQAVYDVALGEIRRYNGTAWRLPKGSAYRGTASGTTDASGKATITHGLGLTPSQVHVVSTQLSAGIGVQCIPIAVGSITGTNFQVRFITPASQSGSDWLVNNAATVAYSVQWVAFE